MKFKHWLLVGSALAVVLLGWETLKLAIENDGLRQVAEGHKRSIQALLVYASVATRCDVTVQELSNLLAATVHASPTDSTSSVVAKLAFKAQYTKGTIARVEIVDVGSVSVCQSK
jgi:hypothetical protein